MSGKIVSQTSIDTCRITILGESRLKNIPASMIVDLDDLLRAMIDDDTEELIVAYDFDECYWTCDWGHYFSRGPTPWLAMIDLMNRKRADKRGIDE